MNERVINEAAFLMAGRCAALLVSVLDEDRYRQAVEGFFVICRAEIEAYCIRQNRMQSRLRPGKKERATT